jgi:hypothetical protein
VSITQRQFQQNVTLAQRRLDAKVIEMHCKATASPPVREQIPLQLDSLISQLALYDKSLTGLRHQDDVRSVGSSLPSFRNPIFERCP